MSCSLEELAHTADIGVRVRAASAESLFACAARALFTLMGITGAQDGAFAAAEVEVAVESADTPALLVDWLNELLYLHETTGLVYDRCTFDAWQPDRLRATVVGAPATGRPIMHIKAVTWHQLLVERDGDGWLAEIFFDI